MADVTAPELHRAFRAEAILTAAIGIVSVLVVILVAILWAGESAHREEEVVVARVRSARAEMILVSQAQNGAEALAGRYAASRRNDLREEYEEAKTSARTHLATLRTIVASDDEAAALAGRIGVLIERRFEILDAEIDARRPQALGGANDGLYAAFRTESEALFVLLNRRIDAARAAENAARTKLNFAAITLAALSLLASGLAILALRRERNQWRLAQAAAERARAQAAASDMAKSRFLAVASHDMRQPLHALTLYLTALERRVETDEARDIIRKMDRATQSMVGMFSMLLDLARVQAGVVTPEIADAPLQDVIERIVAEHPSDTVEAAPTTLSVHTDPRLLERVLSNLVNNALKHGGGKAKISARRENGFALIEVADDGPGIPAEDQARIFEEFVRLNGRGEGLGLGLAIVKGIADLLDAKIELDSAPGAGARFRLRLRLANAQETAAAPISEEDVLRGVPVLVMDDDPLAREAMAETLRDLGAVVRACRDEHETRAELDRGFVPQLLLLDLRIDGEYRGIAVADSAISRLGPQARALIVTGDTGPEALAALRASGHPWLIKPVSPRELNAAAAAQLRA